MIVYQSSNLYVKEDGKYRHIENWDDFLKMGGKLENIVHVNDETIKANLGKPITEWPEKEEPEPTIGPMRLMFNVPEGAHMRTVADMGITDILSYGTEWMEDQGKGFLDSCLDGDGKPFLHVIYSLKSKIHDKPYIRDGNPWNREKVGELVSKFDNHRAVSGWYVLDEPDARNPLIQDYVQRDITNFIRDRSDKPISIALRGGTSGWKWVPLTHYDYIITNTYPYNGSGKLWGYEPLEALKVVGEQEQEYLKDYPSLKVMFIVQCCDEPAVNHNPPYHNTQVPLGHVEDIYRTMKPYGVFSQGVGFWGYDNGYFGPQKSMEMYDEVKKLIGKITG